jgi:hypothetical protein
MAGLIDPFAIQEGQPDVLELATLPTRNTK